MTDANIFQIIGLIYLAIGLGMLINPRFYEAMLKRMIENEAVLFLTGIMVFIIGYFLTAYHNVWVGGSSILITLIGWGALLKGLMLIIIPEQSINLYKAIKITKKHMKLYGVVAFVLGLTLFYSSY